MSDPKLPVPSYNPDKWEKNWSSLTHINGPTPQEIPPVSPFFRGAVFAFCLSCALAVVLLLIAVAAHYIRAKTAHG